MRSPRSVVFMGARSANIENLARINDQLEVSFPIRCGHFYLEVARGESYEEPKQRPAVLRAGVVAIRFYLVLLEKNSAPRDFVIYDVIEQEVAVWDVDDLPLRWDWVHRFAEQVRRVVLSLDTTSARELCPQDIIDRVPLWHRCG